MLFSEYFDVDKKVLEDYGAIDISLDCDTPLFIDPTLIYLNKDENIRKQYDNLVKYITFIYNLSKESNFYDLNTYFGFKETKENWLGLCFDGNKGSGLGKTFAQELKDNISLVCEDKGITKNIHIEKMYLTRKNVGKDRISDMTTRILLPFFINYTQEFARKYLKPSKCKEKEVEFAELNFKDRIFHPITAYLPIYEKDGEEQFVLLTPKSILRKDLHYINHANLLKDLKLVKDTMPNEVLRSNINMVIRSTFADMIRAAKEKNKKITDKQFANAEQRILEDSLKKYPEMYDYFIKSVEDNEGNIIDEAEAGTKEIVNGFNDNGLLKEDPFDINTSSDNFKSAKEEAIHRVNHLKHLIENQEYNTELFYEDGTRKQKSEDILHRLFKGTWANTQRKWNAEVNNGHGPVDFECSKGANDVVSIEFKLASNTHLFDVFKQIKAYMRDGKATDGLVVVFYYSEKEKGRAEALKELSNIEKIDVILVDCIYREHISGSKLH